MPLSVLKDVKKIYAGLNPDEIRAGAHKNLAIGLMAGSDVGYALLEDFIAPPSIPDYARVRALATLTRIAGGGDHKFDFILCEPGIPVPPLGHSVNPADPAATIREIAAAHDSVELSLGRSLPQFRRTVANRIVQRVARENALFALVTALPNVLPSIIDIPWAVGEFATDTAVLTMNQIRMALMMAALNDHPVGYVEQKMQIAAIAGGAFGWRALARELVGKIPLGGGLIPKAAIAYAGTWLVGMGLEKVNRTGLHLTHREKKEAYAEGLGQGKKVARELAPVVVKRR